MFESFFFGLYTPSIESIPIDIKKAQKRVGTLQIISVMTH